MENILNRYRNASILVVVVFAQVLALAVQVKRPGENGSPRLIRVWAVSALTPVEKALTGISNGFGNLWSNYIYLRGVRQQNRTLREQIARIRLEQVRLNEDARQGQRLQSLLGFKQRFLAETVAAQVIGSSGADQARVLYIDKGTDHDLKSDMAVITPDGVVGKVLQVFPSAAQVLLINDASSGVGAALETSRLHGILQGTVAGELVLRYVMSDEKVQPGERVLASGGDRIFPKGFPIGTVTQVSPGSDLFLNIRVKPAAKLGRLEEVLVVTKMAEEAGPPAEAAGEVRAADILAERLPKVPPKPASESKPAGSPKPASAGQGNAAAAVGGAAATGGATKPQPEPSAPPPVAPVANEAGREENPR